MDGHWILWFGFLSSFVNIKSKWKLSHTITFWINVCLIASVVLNLTCLKKNRESSVYTQYVYIFVYNLYMYNTYVYRWNVIESKENQNTFTKRKREEKGEKNSEISHKKYKISCKVTPKVNLYTRFVCVAIIIVMPTR